MRNSTGGLHARIANRQWIDSDATRDFDSVRGVGALDEGVPYQRRWNVLALVAIFWTLVIAAVVAAKVLL